MSLADDLRRAFVSEVQTSLCNDQIPGSQDDAEQVRDEASKSMGPVQAWKLGATIRAVRKDLGLVRPFFGPLPAACVFGDGAEVRGFHTRLRGVECEYGFELARDLGPGDDEGDDEALKALFACVRPTIEIPGTRYSALGIYGGFGLVADFGAAGGLVLGPARPLEDWGRFDKGAVKLFFGQRQVASGSDEPIEGGAVGPLRGFLRQALRSGCELRKGQTIVTGSCTGYLKAPLDEVVQATFDALDASVSVTFRE